MNSQRYERAERKRVPVLVSETDQCRVMTLSDSGQPALKRRRNIGMAQIKHNQTEALGVFADLQHRYASLLADYRPMVQKVDLGAKGIWYRLRIGPIADKTTATKLCTQLKSRGHQDCLVLAR